jgi:hypothetical protein
LRLTRNADACSSDVLLPSPAPGAVVRMLGLVACADGPGWVGNRLSAGYQASTGDQSGHPFASRGNPARSARPASAPVSFHLLPQLRRDLLASPTSASGLGSPPPHHHRDWTRRCHIFTGTGLTPAGSAPGLKLCDAEHGSARDGAHMVRLGSAARPSMTALPARHSHAPRDWARPAAYAPGLRPPLLGDGQWRPPLLHRNRQASSTFARRRGSDDASLGADWAGPRMRADTSYGAAGRAGSSGGGVGAHNEGAASQRARRRRPLRSSLLQRVVPRCVPSRGLALQRPRR